LSFFQFFSCGKRINLYLCTRFKVRGWLNEEGDSIPAGMQRGKGRGEQPEKTSPDFWNEIGDKLP
jgi:hypothetical protein